MPTNAPATARPSGTPRTSPASRPAATPFSAQFMAPLMGPEAAAALVAQLHAVHTPGQTATGTQAGRGTRHSLGHNNRPALVLGGRRPPHGRSLRQGLRRPVPRRPSRQHGCRPPCWPARPAKPWPA